MVCAMKGYPFHPLSSDAFAVEKLDTMRAFGADLEIVPSDGGKVTPALFDRFKARIAELTRIPTPFGPINSTMPMRSTATPASAASSLTRSAAWTRLSARWGRRACWWAFRRP